MGAYCSEKDLDDIMVGVDFDDATTNLAGRCISLAEAEIDTHLSKRYTISSLRALVPPPPKLSMVCCILSAGYMWEFLSRGGKESLGRAKELKKTAMANLKMLMEHEADLIDATGAVITDKTTTNFRVLCNTKDYHPTFNEDNPRQWTVDEDKIEDIEDERQ